MSFIPGAKVSVGVPPPSSSLNLNADDWTSFQFHFHDFASLDSTKDNCVSSPIFVCNGHRWCLLVYPGGQNGESEGKVSIYLFMVAQHDSGAGEGGIATKYQVDIIDELGENRESKKSSYAFSADRKNWGWPNFITRSYTLNNGIIGSDGALTIVVSIEKESTSAFVPQNAALQRLKEMFNDETTSDVCFEVANIGRTKKGKQKKQKSSVSFHAHRNILKKFAPMLADLLGDNDSAAISDMSPYVFRHLFYYVYGGEIPATFLSANAMKFIEAADKYAIVNLKLAAEAAYVESTDITFDNAIDNLLYADGKNCALLKEKVMNFLADHPSEASEKLSFADCPPQVMKDLLAAFGRKGKSESSGSKDKLSKLDVSALRRKLHEKGLEVDGSREAMIESLKNSNATSGERRFLRFPSRRNLPMVDSQDDSFIDDFAPARR